MKVSDYIAKFLADQRVSHIFELSGGMITHLLDSLHRHGGIKIITTHHEQCAGFAAEAVGRMTDVPGVAFATSGPGATNLLTAIGSCYFDSTPTVFITGQVNRHEMKGDRAVRQLGFQETDIVSMVRPVAKAAWQAQTPEEVPDLLRRAFCFCQQGRPGPVLIDIPMDIQRLSLPDDTPTDAPCAVSEDAPSPALVQRLLDELRRAERPLFLVGGGVRSSRSIALLRELVHRTKTPVVNSLNAVDTLPYQDPLRVGMIGAYGNRWANLAIGRSDFLLVLGSRLDIRQTGSETASFKEGRSIFHVDCEAGEINNRVVGCEAILSELPAFFKAALAQTETSDFPERTAWLAEIDNLRCTWPDTKESGKIAGINPNLFMHQLSAFSQDAAAYTVDVGLHQMWAAQSIEVGPDQRYLTSGGMGAMGFALPAAIGAALVGAPRPVVMIAGDGGFQINLQELQTIVRNVLPIKMIVMNNLSHGMSRMFQQTYFDERYGSTLWGYSAPNFAAVAEAYGIPGRTVADETEVEQALQWLWQDPAQPALLQVMVDTFTNAYPKIAFGKPMTEMEPFAKPIEMEST